MLLHGEAVRLHAYSLCLAIPVQPSSIWYTLVSHPVMPCTGSTVWWLRSLDLSTLPQSLSSARSGCPVLMSLYYRPTPFPPLAVWP